MLILSVHHQIKIKALEKKICILKTWHKNGVGWFGCLLLFIFAVVVCLFLTQTLYQTDFLFLHKQENKLKTKIVYLS